MNGFYKFFRAILWLFFGPFHPIKTYGSEHIPEGGALICGNHTSLCDPILVAFAFRKKSVLRVMAKAELLHVPVLGYFLKKAGIFGVDRGKSDIGAIKQAMKYLKGGDKVLLFPEGTRIKDGAESEAKTGAAMLAVRTGVPIVPVWMPAKKRWFSRTPVVIGEAYYPQTAEKKATPEEYREIADDLMARIFALEALSHEN
ncbi:MAG: lysophospholipid acyltransferase family protein [Oscillospiraceae bacterium]